MRDNLKRMISYYRPYLGTFFLDIFFAIVASGIALVIPLAVRSITSEIPNMTADEGLRKILYIGGILIVLLIVQFFANYYISYVGHVMGAKMEYDMRAEIFAHYQKLPFSFYDDQKVGQLMSRITSDLFEITELLHHGPENIVISLIKIIGAFVILAGISGYLTLAAFIMLPFMFLFAFVLNKRMRKAFRKNREKIAEINTQIEDNLSGIRVVKSFANEEIEREKFGRSNENFLRSKDANYRCMGSFMSGNLFFQGLMYLVTLVFGGWLIARGQMEVADLAMYALYIGIFISPIQILVELTEMMQKGLSGFRRFLAVVETEPDIVDAPDAKPLDNVKGTVEYDNVSFHYSDDDTLVLSDVSFRIEAGKSVALVGPSGSGKSTICSLLPRFYDVTGGSVRIDGQDIRDLTLESLRDQIGLVQQDVYLFCGTIRENIAYGKPGASMEEIEDAARKANIHDFIMSLPDGYDSFVGERGTRLSGGQKQRISIARVFLKNPPILILDEATSALDNESERRIQHSLEELAKNRTTITIAHRLSTIRNADEILVVADTGIVERGTHEELLAMNGIYAHYNEMA